MAVLLAHLAYHKTVSPELLNEFRDAMAEGKPLSDRVEKRGMELADAILASNSEGFKRFPRKMYVRLDAAGFRGQVALGAWSVLRRLVEKEKIKIVGLAGGSSGAQSAVLIAMDALHEWVQFVYGWRALRNRLIGRELSVWALLKILLRGGLVDFVHATIECIYREKQSRFLALPENTVHMAVFAWPGREVLLTGRQSWEELSDALHATGAIPGISSGLWARWRDLYCLDGGFACLSDQYRLPSIPQMWKDDADTPVLTCRPSHFDVQDTDSPANFWSLWAPSEALQEKAITYGQDEIAKVLESGGDSSLVFRFN